MSQPGLRSFKEVWLVDFEFRSLPGCIPEPVCMVAVELFSEREIRLWQDELASCPQPPYSIGQNSLIVAYYASAELGCHLALDWPIPLNILDLYAEFRCLTNGVDLPHGKGLLGAQLYFGLDCIATHEKDCMRDLVLNGGPWTTDERNQIMDYCRSDVLALQNLLNAMADRLSIPRASVRGRYMGAAARMEHTGVPIDVDALTRLKSHWTQIQDALIQSIDRNYQVYEGRTFKRRKWERFVRDNGIPWPILDSGELDLKDETFREMARAHPIVAPMHELRTTLSKMKLSELEVGPDGRNRRILSAFSSKTGRNQPSTSKFIFGPATWIRGLIRPEPGMGIAYVDWEQQEFGIAAALSRDPLMKEAYQSGDPYLAFAKQARAIPENATKESHGVERNKFKACVLAVQYGMGARSLSNRIGCSEYEASELLRLHRVTYRVFWRWSDAVVDCAELDRELWTTFGWQIHYPDSINPRSVRNFPMQANGAEMLRLACCYATECGVKVCAPVHDAILIEFDLENEESAISETQQAMREASAIVLDGFELRTEVKTVRYPDRYMDERGRQMWDTVWRILDRLEN